MDAKELSNQIKSEFSSEDVNVETVDDKVLVTLNTENKTTEEISDLIKNTIDAVTSAREKTGTNETDVLIGGIDKDIKSMASANVENKIKRTDR